MATAKSRASSASTNKNTTPTITAEKKESFPLFLTFLVLVWVRILSALFQPIQDCDETFNYWEPTHLLMYGTGLQTWEYSPVYGLRSYFYVVIHSAIGIFWRWIFSLDQVSKFFKYFFEDFFVSKIQIFYLIRATLGVFCALCETVFVDGINCHYGYRVALTTSVFLALAPGMFISGASYLPSTFDMYFLMLAFGFWYKTYSRPKKTSNWIHVIMWTGVAGLVGWPFCIVSVIPLGLDLLARFGVTNFLIYGGLVATTLLSINLGVDYYYYKKIVFATMNLLLYNKGSGSTLYGTEPYYYYFFNMILNFNGAFILALLVPLALGIYLIIFRDKIVIKRTLYSFLFITPFYIWFSFFSSLPHKEERFIYVVYPVCCLAGAYCLELFLNNIYAIFFNKKVGEGGSSKFAKFITFCVLIVFSILSISRIYCICSNYSAPFAVYDKVYHDIIKTQEARGLARKKQINVCVGKEWHRYATSFFLPSEPQYEVKIQFIKSKFNGLLPKYYEKVNPTSVIPTEMNDMNREEMSRYLDVSKCDYLIDYDFPDQTEEHYLKDTKNWTILDSRPFLDVNRSKNSIARAFYIPNYSDKFNLYGPYHALKRNENI